VARAFAWTHANIGKFGGRADEIFVAGHSAGGHLVALLATDESYLKAQGLTLRAIRGAVPISGVYDVPDGTLMRKVFGDDAAARKLASPTHHACAGAPPFLIIYSTTELPGCEGTQAEAFAKALRGQGCSAVTFEAKNRNHGTVLLNAMFDDDPVAQQVLGFVASRVVLHRLETDGAAGAEFLARFIALSGGN
jgi:acetyl esterase/lipase